MTSYYVEYHELGSRWRRYPEKIWNMPGNVLKTKSGWRLDCGFVTPEQAYEGLMEYAQEKPDINQLRIVRVKRGCTEVVFTEQEVSVVRRQLRRNWRNGDPMPSLGACYSEPIYNDPQEETAMDDAQGTAPLHVPRQDLIDALQTKLEEKQKERQEAENKATAVRQEVLDAVGKLTDDQIANIINHYVTRGGNSTIRDFAEDVVSEQKFVSEASKPSTTETRLEKYVRVLTLANDDEIEVPPTDPLWPLL